MAEDFSSASYVVIGSHIVKTSSTKIDFTDLNRNEDAYVYKDFGANYFKNFTYNIDILLNSSSTDFGLIIIGMANILDDAKAVETAAGDALQVSVYENVGVVVISLREVVGGVVYSTTWNGALNTIYYLTVSRDSGSYNLDIYSDSGRTTHIKTLNLILHSIVNYRYFYPVQSYNSSNNLPCTGYVQNAVISSTVVMDAFPVISNEDFTTYTEVDTTSSITVSPTSISVVDSLTTASHVYYNKGAEYFTGARIRFQTQVTGTAIGQTTVLGISDTSGNYSSWTKGVYVKWDYNGTRHTLVLGNKESSSVSSISLNISTTYYCEFRRHGKWAKLYIYSDSLYTSIVDYIYITNINEVNHYRYVYGMTTNGTTATVACSVSNLAIDHFDFTGISETEYAITPTLSHDSETYPGTGWTEVKPAGTTIEQSSTWKQNGTYSVHIIGKSDGTDDAALTQTFTASTKNVWVALATVKIISIADGNVCRLFGIGDTVAGKYLQAGVYRNGSQYKWTIASYTSGTGWIKTDSDFDVVLNQVYKVSLILQADPIYTASKGIALSVNGDMVVQLAADNFLPSQVNKGYIGYIGGSTTWGANSERYVDDFYFRKENVLRFGCIERIGNKLLVAGTPSSNHDSDYTVAGVLMSSTDNGMSWQIVKTFDDDPLKAEGAASIVKYNDSILYLWGNRVHYGVNYLYYFKKIDSFSRISITNASQIAFSSLPRNEDVYLYNDYGVDYFNGDFSHKVNVKLNSGNDSCVIHFWAISNVISSQKYVETSGGNALQGQFNKNGTKVDFYIREVVSGTLYYTSYAGVLNLNTWYYLTIARTGTSFTIKIYSDSARTSLLTTLTLTLHSVIAYRYLYAISGHNDGLSGYAGTGNIENLSFNAGAIRTDIWKSTDTGVTWNKVFNSDTTTPKYIRCWPTKIIENGKILCISLIMTDYYISTTTKLQLVHFNTITDTFDALPSGYICQADDIVGESPSEGDMYRRPSDNALIAIIRWDNYIDGLPRHQAWQVSYDDGVTWSIPKSLQYQWEQKAGNIRVNLIDNLIWLAGYNLISSTVLQNFIMCCNPENFDIVNEKRFNYGSISPIEIGNGQATYLTEGNNIKIYLYMHVAGHLKFLQITRAITAYMKKFWWERQRKKSRTSGRIR